MRRTPVETPAIAPDRSHVGWVERALGARDTHRPRLPISDGYRPLRGLHPSYGPRCDSGLALSGRAAQPGARAGWLSRPGTFVALRLPKGKSRHADSFSYSCCRRGGAARAGDACRPGKSTRTPSAVADACKPRGPMKLFRTAFWLGVVLINLPSPPAQPGRPASPAEAHRGPAVAARSQCTRMACSGTIDDAARIGAARDRVLPPQDTLTPADRALLWRGPAWRKPLRSDSST
jgi:hypothetical protein